MVAYASADGGKTWELTLEKKAEKGGPWYGDPTVAFGPDGAAYFAAMFSGGLGMEITSSRDGGRTWGAPFMAKQFMDRPFLVVDCTNRQVSRPSLLHRNLRWGACRLPVTRRGQDIRSAHPPGRQGLRSRNGHRPGRGALRRHARRAV